MYITDEAVIVNEQRSADLNQLKESIKNIVKEVAGSMVPENLSAIGYVQYLRDYLENIIGLMPGHVFWVDTNNVYLGSNDLHATNGGLKSRRDIIGKTNYELPWKEQAEELHRINQKVIQTGQAMTLEEHGVTTSGSRLYLTEKVPLRDPYNNIIGVLGISFDITERKPAEEANLGLALQSFRIGTWSWDIANDNFTHKYIHDEKHYVFTGTFAAALERIHQHDQEKVRGAILKAIEQNDFLDIEYRVIWADGSVRYMALRGKVIRDTLTNQVIKIAGISWDITDRKKMEEAIRKQEKELAQFTRMASMGELASTLAHELNQPLTIIANYTRGCVLRLQKDNCSKEELMQVLDQVSAQAIRAGEIIHRMKNFIRKGELFYDIININTIIKEIVSLIHLEQIDHAVDIKLDLMNNIPDQHLDKVQIGQALLNLLRNGIEAMQEANTINPYLKLKTTLVNSVIEVDVIDNGPGLLLETSSSLMEPYFTTKQNGMGMGLAICRTIIEAHGGRLQADNHPDGGAWFKFYLPI